MEKRDIKPARRSEAPPDTPGGTPTTIEALQRLIWLAIGETKGDRDAKAEKIIQDLIAKFSK